MALHLLAVLTSAVLAALAFGAFCAARRRRARSPLRDVPGPPAQSWWKGNLGQLFTPKGLPFHEMLVARYGGVAKVYGFFGDEQLYISDPRALHSILVKDQDAFDETPVFIETNKAIFGPGLVATTGAHHRRQRKLVAPVFARAHLRALTPVFHDIAEKLADVLAREGAGVRDMNEWLSRAALESVGRTILGHSFDPLDARAPNAYTAAVKELIPTIFSLALVRQLAPFLARLGPPRVRRALVALTPVPAVQRVRRMADVMHAAARGILARKRAAPDARARDVISVLLRSNAAAAPAERLSDAELTGQMTVLIFGAQDTTASALSRIVHMLALHPGVQAAVRAEVRAAGVGRAGARLGYDEVGALPWLDAVVKETLRLHPPVTFVARTTLRTTALPLSAAPGSVTVPAGTTLLLSLAGPNRLPAVWGPDAGAWKPERWLGAGPHAHASRARARVPGVYAGMMSFLGGARSCIGYQFALLEMKVILATLLARFAFAPTGADVVWNLAVISAPYVRARAPGKAGAAGAVEERKGLPLVVTPLRDDEE